jgi:hypothetical protein
LGSAAVTLDPLTNASSRSDAPPVAGRFQAPDNARKGEHVAQRRLPRPARLLFNEEMRNTLTLLPCHFVFSGIDHEKRHPWD